MIDTEGIVTWNTLKYVSQDLTGVKSRLIQVPSHDAIPVVMVTMIINPDIKVYGANMGPTWVLSAPDGPNVGPMNLAIRGRVTLRLGDNES